MTILPDHQNRDIKGVGRIVIRREMTVDLNFRNQPPKRDRYTVRFEPGDRRLAEAAADRAGVRLSEFVRASVRAAAQEVVSEDAGGSRWST